MMVPPGTSCPPNALKPSRCAFESRPFRDVPCPFLCAINQFSVAGCQLPVIHPTKIACHPERSEGPASRYFFLVVFFATAFLAAFFFAGFPDALRSEER